MGVTLRPRLEAVARLLGECEMVADIGCDHGRLSVALLQRKQAQYVFASDISRPSVTKASALYKKCGISDEKITVACAGGLSALPKNYDGSIAICGMGGELIANMIEEASQIAYNAQKIVMQPMGGTVELRKYLLLNGYSILDEEIVLDAGRYYQIISARFMKTSNDYLFSDVFLEFGYFPYMKRAINFLNIIKRTLTIRERELKKAEMNGVILRELNSNVVELRKIIKEFEGE